MTDRQNMVVALTVVSLLIGIVFFVPWRTAPDDKLLWAPAYRQPIVATADYWSDHQGLDVDYPSGRVALDIMALQVVAIAACGAAAFRMASAYVEPD